MYIKCLILLAVVSCAVLIADAKSVKDLKGKVIPDSLKSLIADPREAKRYFSAGKRNTKTHVKRDGDSGDDKKCSGGSSNDSGGSDSGGSDSNSGGSSNDSGGSNSGGSDSNSGGSSNDSGGSDSGGSDSN